LQNGLALLTGRFKEGFFNFHQEIEDDDNDDEDNEDNVDKVSISPIFFKQLFHAKVF